MRTLDPATDLGRAFAALLGRQVLRYVDDPINVVHRCARTLRPGRILPPMEYDMTAARSPRTQPLTTQAV